MPSFLNPFSGNIPEKKMSNAELVRALQLDLAGELEAIATYNAHADACEDEFVAEALRDIANEEVIHTAELLKLIQYLSPKEKELMEQGYKEIADLAEEHSKKIESSEPSDKTEE